MIVDVVQAASFLEITRVHKLPYPGRVLVKENQTLNPGDIIAEAGIPGKVIMLDIAKGLGLSPEETKACLIREVDENLEEGDVIAQCEKTLPRLFRAPIKGKIISYHKGKMALATGEERIVLHAKMIGSVSEVIPEYGAVISVKGSLFQGMWGNGRTGCGTLRVLDSANDSPLEATMLKDLTSGQILMGSTFHDQDFIAACQEKEISGLILSSLSPDLIESALSISFPVILLHGFGMKLFAEDIYDSLKSNNGSLVSANASQRDNLQGQCPEIIIPKEEGNLEKSLGFRKKLEVGDRVRMISGKAIYQTGKVVELLEIEQVFENGLTLPAAIVKLQSLEKIKVPQQNLLIIG